MEGHDTGYYARYSRTVVKRNDFRIYWLRPDCRKPSHWQPRSHFIIGAFTESRAQTDRFGGWCNRNGWRPKWQKRRKEFTGRRNAEQKSCGRKKTTGAIFRF